MRLHLFVAAMSSMLAFSALGQPAQTIPDFSGLWAHPNVGWEYPVSGPGPVRHKPGATGSANLIGDDTNPVLKPATAAIIRRNSQISASGLAFPDPDNQCMSQPVPYIFWNFEIQLLQQPDKITILYNHDHDFREVRLNQPHPAKIRFCAPVRWLRTIVTRPCSWNASRTDVVICLGRCARCS